MRSSVWLDLHGLGVRLEGRDAPRLPAQWLPNLACGRGNHLIVIEQMQRHIALLGMELSLRSPATSGAAPLASTPLSSPSTGAGRCRATWCEGAPPRPPSHRVSGPSWVTGPAYSAAPRPLFSSPAPPAPCLPSKFSPGRRRKRRLDQLCCPVNNLANVGHAPAPTCGFAKG